MEGGRVLQHPWWDRPPEKAGAHGNGPRYRSWRANPSHRELDVLGDPGFQTVRKSCQEACLIILHLSGSEFVEIVNGFCHVFHHFWWYSLPRRDILGSLFLLPGVYSRSGSASRVSGTA